MIIKQAILADAETLTHITLKSKAHWGYSDEQIESWIEELTISKTYIETNHVFKLLIQEKTIAYYSYCMESDTTVTLDNLFVLPDYMRKGYGSYLLKDF
ncbi:GNAT family N-acetyltransferase [Flavobacterium psychrotrophum]|uniref:GNAT family N-acetyltransferase n=1 Tax=Flavobacterium psychrotrophum TaxID=2294119 RepID=UPI000E316DCE|nr:GNAT family N-acetyltransferase [Flavobacterium psychrotrophum]